MAKKSNNFRNAFIRVMEFANMGEEYLKSCDPEEVKRYRLTENTNNLEKLAESIGFDECVQDQNECVPGRNECVPEKNMQVTFQNVLDSLDKWNLTKTFSYYAVNHDKDVNKEGNPTPTHCHIVIQFGSNTRRSDIEKVLPFNTHIDICKSVPGATQYLIHANNPEKYQYPVTDIRTNNPEQLKVLLTSTRRQCEVKTSVLLERIKNGEIPKSAQFSGEIDPVDWAKNKAVIQNEYFYLTQNMVKYHEKDITVYYITGASHNGKTEIAKDLARDKYPDFLGGKPFYLAGPKDHLQNYMDEPVLILDDFPDTSVPFDLILHYLDNHNTTPWASRYSDKVFTGDIIIITSVVPITGFYAFDGDKKRPFNELYQLYRRIGHYMDVQYKQVYHYMWQDGDIPNKGEYVYKNDFPNYIRIKYPDIPAGEREDNLTGSLSNLVEKYGLSDQKNKGCPVPSPLHKDGTLKTGLPTASQALDEHFRNKER